MKNELKFTELNDEFRKAVDEYLKRKSKERDNIAICTIKDKLKDSLACDFESLQRAIELDHVSEMKTIIACLYVQTLCANHIYHKHDFDAIVESAIKKTNDMHDFVMGLDKREHIRSIDNLLSDIDDSGLNERNIALIIITIYMISLQYGIVFNECIANIKAEDIL